MKSLKVEKQYENCRLDRFLKEQFNLSQGLICKYLRKKVIKLNGQKGEINSRIFFQDEISYFDFAKLEDGLKGENLIRDSDIKLIKDRVIFENDEIIAINKPYGINVQKASHDDISIIDILMKIYGNDVRIIHRLDRNTSGVMIFAKDKFSCNKYSEFFKKHEVQKKYIAILDGVVKLKSGRIESRIEKLSQDGDESIAKQGDFGKEAVSDFCVIKVDEKNKYSVVEFEPKTGRMHQVRLHALKLGFAIIGDQKYNKNYKKGQKLLLESIYLKLPEISEIKILRLEDHFTSFFKL